MKYLCLILSFFVVLLSARPCCTGDDCKANSVVNNSPGKASKEKECAGCSPFFTCGSCIGFVAARPIVYALPFMTEVPVIRFIAYGHPNIKDISLTIWQPPQLS